MNFEKNYSESLKNIIERDVLTINRTGINTLTVKHQYFNIKNINIFLPILQGKKIFPKLALKELIWMLMGRTDIKWLQDNGVNYWNEWSKEDGTIGPSYGKQFRDFNGVDQLQKLVDDILKDHFNRRLIINLWNPNDLSEMALPPCFYDFHVTCEQTQYDGEIVYVDLHVRSRSEDSFLGMPYDALFCSWFLIFLTSYLTTHNKTFHYYPRDVHYTADDYHLYENHLEPVKEYLNNVENTKLINIPWYTTDDIFLDNSLTSELSLDEYIDFWLKNIDKIYFDNYFSHDKIKAQVAI